MNNTPFKKRTDPFATPFPKTETPIEQVVVEKPIVETVVEAKPVVKAAPQKKVVAVVDDANREKYTATMDKMLRRRVKVACAQDGIQVSTFIEQACLEKLEREGR